MPAASVRRVADEFVAHARIGATIEIEGQTLPHRPVGIMLGKGINNGWGGYQVVWARTLLACLVGALEVPGGNVGTKVRLNRPADNRMKSVKPGPDGFMEYPFNATSKQDWQAKPHIRNAYKMLVPLAANSPWSAALGPAHLPWLFQKDPPKPWTRQTLPDMWICYRTNPAISSWNAPFVARTHRRIPVHAGVRLHAGRVQLHGRRAAAGGDRHREPAAVPHRQHRIRREVLAPPGLGDHASRRSPLPANAWT